MFGVTVIHTVSIDSMPPPPPPPPPHTHTHTNYTITTHKEIFFSMFILLSVNFPHNVTPPSCQKERKKEKGKKKKDSKNQGKLSNLTQPHKQQNSFPATEAVLPVLATKQKLSLPQQTVRFTNLLLCLYTSPSHNLPAYSATVK